MITIPQNTYVEPTEVRENVLECIIDALLKGQEFKSYSWNSVFRTTYVSDNPNSYGRHTFENTYYGTPKNCTRIRTCEVQKAFDMLIASGYFIYRYSDRDVISYALRRSGSIQDRYLGRVVTKMSENIDH